MKIKPSKHTAVLNKKGDFNHFGVNELNACVYGDKIEDIIEVEISIADDQTIPPAPQKDPNINVVDYWGWWDSESKRFTLVFGKYFLLDMCFPYGMPVEENKGTGKAYRVNVKKIEK